MRINIAEEFTDTPAGRYHADGPFSGEKFREEILRDALATGELVVVELDDAEGFGSSFLEEAFGGLVRHGYFTIDRLHEILELSSKDESLVLEIWDYIDTATPTEDAVNN